MLNIYMDSNGEFEYEGIKWKIDVVKRPALGSDEIRRYIQLYKNGNQCLAVSNVDLECCDIPSSTLSQFMHVLKEAVNDNFCASKNNVTIPLEVFRDLFKKWK